MENLLYAVGVILLIAWAIGFFGYHAGASYIFLLILPLLLYY